MNDGYKTSKSELGTLILPAMASVSVLALQNDPVFLTFLNITLAKNPSFWLSLSL